MATAEMTDLPMPDICRDPEFRAAVDAYSKAVETHGPESQEADEAKGTFALNFTFNEFASTVDYLYRNKVRAGLRCETL